MHQTQTQHSSHHLEKTHSANSRLTFLNSFFSQNLSPLFTLNKKETLKKNPICLILLSGLLASCSLSGVYCPEVQDEAYRLHIAYVKKLPDTREETKQQITKNTNRVYPHPIDLLEFAWEEAPLYSEQESNSEKSNR